MEILYFAYGSNMCINRLRARVPSCKFESIATLKKYKLQFHKRSNKDNSGKCNAFYTENDKDQVIGVVFSIKENEEINLDRAEGLGKGYKKLNTIVETNNKAVNVFTYIADSSFIDDTLLPFTWYKDFVLEGAKQHNLDQEYIKEIDKVKTIVDQDSEREKRERSIFPC